MLSVILTNYNYGQYLKECIESILNQKYSNYELIIIDDASTDDSIKIIHHYALTHPQIRVVQNSKNQGLFNSLRSGIKLAKGSYIYLCAADDLIFQKFFDETMGLFNRQPHLKMICTDFCYLKDNGEIKEEKKLLKMNSFSCFSAQDILKVYKNSPFWVPGPSVIFAKEIWEKYGGFDAKLVTLSDWFLFQNIALHEGVGYIPKTLTAMRLHEKSLTSLIKKDKKKRRAIYRYLLKQLVKNKETKKLFMESGLLNFIFRELFIRLLINPLYMSYWPYLYRHFRVKKSL